MRSSPTLLLLFLAIGLLASACNKPDIADCRRGCWNYNRIMFWDKVDREVKNLAPEEAAAIRAQREQIFRSIQEREEDPGLLNCITSCQHDLSKEGVRCLEEAKTAATLALCIEE